MSITARIRALPGIRELAILMATANNKSLLAQVGFIGTELETATANDLLLAVRAESEDQLSRALAEVDRSLASKPQTFDTDDIYPTLEAALSARPQTNLAIISVPGEFAARESRLALEHGLNVLLFSDNVAIEREIELKELASRRGRILMGPDCGTAIINGVPLGFANAVRLGRIGIVAASGTGLQEVACLIDRAGQGISQAIGTGGRDLSDQVGGISMLQGLSVLNADKGTDALVLISKPPGAVTCRRILDFLSSSSKPSVVAFLGADIQPPIGATSRIAQTLEEAARQAVDLVAPGSPSIGSNLNDVQLQGLANDESKEMSRGQRYVRGLYSGGTLCYEAMLILEHSLGGIYSNIPLRPELHLENLARGYLHTCLDLGEDWFTRGKPHPMISPDSRIRYIESESDDPEVAVLLLDLVLGFGSHPDMAGALTEPIRTAKKKARERGNYLSVIASVCGTDRDLQGFAKQVGKLHEAGVVVMDSNAQAARLAALIASQRQKER